MFTRFRILLVLAVIALVAGGTFWATGRGAEARAMDISIAEAFVIGEPENFVGGSWLLRGNNHIEMAFNTTGLEPNTVHTVWWVIFNKPENCNEDGCNADDLPPLVDGVRQEDQNPAEASSLWATGAVIGDDGSANFHARLLRRFSPGEVLFGPGLTNPKGAEVHLVVRTHGAILPGEIGGQISSFGLGCNPDCANVQVAIHMSASMGNGGG